MESSGDINVVPPPRRNSAKKAVVAFAHQFSGLDSGGSGDEMGPAKWNGRASAKVKYVKKATGRKRSASVKESATNKPAGLRAKKNTGNTPSTGPVAVASSSTEPPPSRPRPRPRPKPKKPTVEEIVPAPIPHTEVNDYGNDDALSDLTPLSSSESERRSSSPELVLVEDIRTKIPIQPNPPHAISLATQLAITPKLSKKPRNEPLWSLSGLGTYVWVLIEPKSRRVFDENEGGEDGKERVWWPAKVRTRIQLLKLS